MKFCIDCQSYDDGYCPIKKFNVSINANFCEDYKVSIDGRRKELLEWLLVNKFQLPPENVIDMLDIMLAWGDKCLNDKK